MGLRLLMKSMTLFACRIRAVNADRKKRKEEMRNTLSHASYPIPIDCHPFHSMTSSGGDRRSIRPESIIRIPLIPTRRRKIFRMLKFIGKF